MFTRSSWMIGLSATLLSLTFVGGAGAQDVNRGRRLERQMMNNVGNLINGTQPNYPNPNYPAPTQPYYNPSQIPQAGYAMPGYQPQAGPSYYPQGGSVYQQPQQAYYQRPQPYYYQQPQQAYYQRPQPYYYQQPQQPVSGPALAQRYQLPAQFAGTAPGSVVSYGGANYIVGNDGTMTAYSGPAQTPATTQPAASGVVANQRYQIPPEFAGTASGYIITYGGRNYLTGDDGTMTLYTGPVAR
jgi:hypothetical protein